MVFLLSCMAFAPAFIIPRSAKKATQFTLDMWKLWPYYVHAKMTGRSRGPLQGKKDHFMRPGTNGNSRLDRASGLPQERGILDDCVDRKSTRLNSSHVSESRMPS